MKLSFPEVPPLLLFPYPHSELKVFSSHIQEFIHCWNKLKHICQALEVMHSVINSFSQ